jgi:Tfp pilus assembly major pilin PilA
MRRKDNRQGFALAEFLLLAAVFVMLVIILTPVVRSYVERSYESADFINVRTAYAGVKDSAVADDDQATYAGEVIKQTDGTFRAVIHPLTQEIDGWTTNVSGLKIGEVYGYDWLGSPKAKGSCILTYDPEADVTQLVWGNRYFGLTLAQNHAIDDQERVQADQETLRSLGEVILDFHWARDELVDCLALPESTDKVIRIAEYDQLKKTPKDGGELISAGFRINASPSGMLNSLLEEAGYYPGDTSEKINKEGTKDVTTNQYALFFSDELAANKYKNYPEIETARGIFITDIETDKKGKIEKFTIYSDSINGQAEIPKNAKEQFRVEIED